MSPISDQIVVEERRWKSTKMGGKNETLQAPEDRGTSIAGRGIKAVTNVLKWRYPTCKVESSNQYMQSYMNLHLSYIVYEGSTLSI